MTAPQHQAAAAAATAEAQQHRQLYDPRARSPAGCEPYSVGECAPYWSSGTNPTARHLREAKRYRALAARHRAASAALREAEARSCSAVPAADRDISPFHHREDIDRVERIEKEAFGPGGLLGARVVFHARPGLTAEWLQRVVDCHLARWAAYEHQDPALRYCPLAVSGVTATVKSTGDGFAVEILAKDEATAALVIARAEALAPRAQAQGQ